MLDTSLLMLWLAVVSLALALGLVALRSANGAAMRALVVGVVVVLAGVTYAAGERVLGNARPVAFEAVKPAEPVRVLYTQAIQGKGIYLLLANDQVPTYFRLPWDENTAKELRQALQKAEENQTPLMFRFEPSLDDRESMFYAMPQPKLPEKEPPERGLEYRDREWRI